MPDQAIHFHGLTEIGPVREENQDAIFLTDGACPPAAGPLFALADGMGGYAQGGLASRLALQALHDTCCNFPNGSLAGTLKRAVEAANQAVCAEAARLGVARMGTTLTAAAIEGSRLHLAHIGDSRAYLLRGPSARQLTQDHTVVGDLLRMKIISPEQVRTHARRSVLTKAVGLGLFVQPDVFSIDLHPGDRFLLCSDGLWSLVEDDEFASLSTDYAPLPELCRALIDLAIQRGADDNLSVIAVHVHETPEPPGGPPPPRKKWLERVFRR